MPIAIVCGSCEARLNAPDAAAGKRVKCPKCATLLVIPLPESEADFEVLDDEPKAKPKPKPTTPAKTKPKPVMLDEDDEDDRPAPKKKPKPVARDDDDDDDEPRPKRKPMVLDDDDDEPRPKKRKGDKQPAPKGKLPLVLGVGGGGLVVVGVAVWLAFFNGTGETVKPPPAGPIVQQPGPNPVIPPSPGPVTPPSPGPNPGNPNPPVVQPPADPLAGAPRLQPSGRLVLGKKVTPSTITARAGISKDGRYFGVNASGGQLWELSGTPKRIRETSNLLQVLSNGTAIQFGMQPQLFDVATNRVLGSMPLTGARCAYGAGGVLCARSGSDFSKPTGGVGGFITVWDAAEEKETLDLKIPDYRFREAIATDDGKRLWLFMTAKKYEVECWNVSEKRLERTVKPEPPAGMPPFPDAGLHQSVSGDSAVVSSAHNNTRTGRQYLFHDVATGRLLPGLAVGLTGTQSGFLPFGQIYVVQTKGKSPTETALYDVKGQKVITVLAGHASPKGALHVVASADGKRAVSVAEDGEVLVYDLSSLNLK